MKKLVVGAAVLAVVMTGAIFAEDKPVSIDTIMKKVNGGKGLHKKVGEAVKSASPNWETVAKQTAEYKKLADDLGKNTPPKGDQANWEKLTKAYAENAKKLNDAADKKDKDAATKSWTALQKSCKACHDAHQPE